MSNAAHAVREVRAKERQPERDEDREHPDERAAGATLAAVHLDDAEAAAAAARSAQTAGDVVARRAWSSGVNAQVVARCRRRLLLLLLLLRRNHVIQR